MSKKRWSLALLAGCALTAACQPAAPPPAPAPDPAAVKAAQVERGRYLVVTGGCSDCHTPKVMTEKGPEPDMTRLLSGHPAAEVPPPVPDGVLSQNGWVALVNGDLTAWAGPWGVSFPRNLTPDPTTGLGSWTEDMFIKTLRLGKHQGEGRNLLPPMPWQSIGQFNDDDLKAIWAYLQSIPAIDNPVPDPLPPAEAPPTAPAK